MRVAYPPLTLPRTELAPIAIGGVIWLPAGGDAAVHALETVYRGGE
jgi:hypothetical protein